MPGISIQMVAQPWAIRMLEMLICSVRYSSRPQISRTIGNLVGVLCEGIRTVTGIVLSTSIVPGLAWRKGIRCSTIGGSRYLIVRENSDEL